MPTDNKRLLLEIEKTIREINRETINPVLPEVVLSDLEPTLRLVARARAAYIKGLVDMAAELGENGMPDLERIKGLRLLRLTFEELVAGAKALEISIERGYLDVQHG
jgi:hypothetical protein